MEVRKNLIAGHFWGVGFPLQALHTAYLGLFYFLVFFLPIGWFFIDMYHPTYSRTIEQSNRKIQVLWDQITQPVWQEQIPRPAPGFLALFRTCWGGGRLATILGRRFFGCSFQASSKQTSHPSWWPQPDCMFWSSIFGVKFQGIADQISFTKFCHFSVNHLVLFWCLKGQAFFRARKTVIFSIFGSMGILDWWQPEIRWGNQLSLVVPPIYDRLLCPSPVVGNWISEPSTTSFCCLYFCLGTGWKFTRFHKKIQHAANYKNWSYTITCRFLHHLSCPLGGWQLPEKLGIQKIQPWFAPYFSRMGLSWNHQRTEGPGGT